MATLTQLTTTQSTLIRAAAIRPDGEVNCPRQSRGLEIVSPSKGLRRLLSQP
jgi:hypothetical protein